MYNAIIITTTIITFIYDVIIITMTIIIILSAEPVRAEVALWVQHCNMQDSQAFDWIVVVL